MFAIMLQRLRIEKDLTRQQVAKKLGITAQAYGNYEKGKRQPDYDTLIKLADFFDVSIDFLLGRKYKNLYKENENVFFVKADGLDKSDIEDVKKHVEFLRFKARQSKQ